MMKISIITVVFNNEKTIGDAMESVLSQTYENIEYIIIDGASTDRTLDIVKRYADFRTKIISEPDFGIYYAMNKGIKLASGDVIGILNSDDLYQDTHVLKDVMINFIQDSDLEVLYGDLEYVKSDDVTKTIRRWISMPYSDKFFEKGNVPPHPSLFLKAKVYREAGLFDTTYKLAADYEFMLRIFKRFAFKSKYINRLMVRMRLGGATNGSFRNIFNGNREIIKAWKGLELKSPAYLMVIRLYKRLAQFL